MKRFFVAAVICMLNTASFAVTPLDHKSKRELISLDYLMEACAVIGETANGMISHFDCESYLYGVMDADLVARQDLKTGEKSCAKVNVAPWQFYEDIQSTIPRSEWHKPAAPLLVKLLRSKYVCK